MAQEASIKEDTCKSMVFEEWPCDKHTIGSSECKAGICGHDSGWNSGVVPKSCPCGGVVHGNCDLSTINETCGPFERFQCDQCKKEYVFDEVRDLEKILV